MFVEHYDFDHDYAQELRDEWNENAKKIRTIAIILSIVMIVVGVLCFAFQSTAFAVMTVLAAVVLVVIGVMHLVNFFKMPPFLRDPLAVLNGVFSILVAILLFVAPLTATATALGFIFAFLLLASGFEKLGLGWRLGFYLDMKHGWITFSAVLDIILAVLFFIMPIVGVSAVGYLIAAYLVVAGIAVLIEAISFKPEAA